MAWIGLLAGLPFLLLILLPLLRPFTDRMGWTRIKGKERTMLSTALQGWNLAFFTEWYNAAEYQKACHDEEDHLGGKQRPHFPGVSDGVISIRPVRDRAGDLTFLAQLLGRDPADVRQELLVQLPEVSVAAVVEVSGRAAGYLQFCTAGESNWRVERSVGDQGARSTAVLRLLLAYLFQFEGAHSVDLPPDLRDLVPEEAGPPPGVELRLGEGALGCHDHPFHLLLLQ